MERRLEQMAKVLRGKKRMLVLTHDNPDPDCIASGWALTRVIRKLTRLRVELAYAGIIGRNENRTLTEVLRVPLRPLTELDIRDFDAFALVDSQPETGNNSLPQGILPDIVIDHHPKRKLTEQVAFHDIRQDFGATASMLTEYLEAAKIRIDRRLATALFYAIKSETQNLGRGSSRADMRAFLKIFPLVDNQALSQIEHPPLSRAYFAMVDQAIAGTEIFGPVAMTRLGEVHNPDVVSQFADLIVRLEDIRWALTIGRYGRDLLVSIRTDRPKANAGRLIQQIVGKAGKSGGHGMMAGGKITDGALTGAVAEEHEARVRDRTLTLLRASRRGEPLVHRRARHIVPDLAHP